MRILIVACMVLAPTVGATEFKVFADGSGEYPTIVDALAVSADGDTISLGDGIYTGEGNRDLSNWGNLLHIRSLSGNPESCIIDCAGSPGDPHYGFWLSITGSKVLPPIDFWGLDGICIMNGYSAGAGAVIVSDGAWPGLRNCIFRSNRSEYDGGAIDIDESGLEIENCLFIDNSAEEGGAISFDYYSAFHVSDCTFIGNSALRGGAIRFRRTNWISEMSGCTFYDNSADTGSNFYFMDDAHLEASNCILAFAEGGETVVCESDCSALFTCCDLFGNTGGDWTGCIEDQLGVDGNISADPLFCDLAILDLTIDAESPCAPLTPPNENCELIGAWSVGCGATAATDKTWSEFKLLYE